MHICISLIISNCQLILMTSYLMPTPSIGVYDNILISRCLTTMIGIPGMYTIIYSLLNHTLL